MKLIAQVKLLPTPEQADALRHTLEQANVACRFVSDTAWETKTFRQYDSSHPAAGSVVKSVHRAGLLRRHAMLERVPG
jgi:hypothetical protein